MDHTLAHDKGWFLAKPFNQGKGPTLVDAEANQLVLGIVDSPEARVVPLGNFHLALSLVMPGYIAGPLVDGDATGVTPLARVLQMPVEGIGSG